MKDPAILFYTSDFLTGITFFKEEQIGQYIKLLCQQHQLGHLPVNHMITVCGTLENPVVSKFKVDDKGLYYNQRMDEEIEKRLTYCNTRSHKGLAGRKKKSYDNHTKTVRQSYGNHTENENDNDNSIGIEVESKNKIKKNKHLDCVLLFEEEFEKLKGLFGDDTDKKIKALNDYIMSTGKKYKSHYHTILNWENKNGTQTTRQPRTTGKPDGYYPIDCQ